MAKRLKGRGVVVPPAGVPGPEGSETVAMIDKQAGMQGVSPDLEALARNVEGQPGPPSYEANSLNQDPQLIQDFLIEAREHLATIEARMLEIEQGAATAETLHAAFRSFHTIKGLAGFLDFTVIQEVAHEVESLLDLARNGELELTPARIDVILAAGDYLASWLYHIEGVQPQAPARHVALIERVHAATREETVSEGSESVLPEPAPPQPGMPEGAPLAGEPAEAGGPETGGPDAAGPLAQGGPAQRVNEAALVKVATGKLEYLVDMVGELVIAQSILRHNQELGQVKSPRLQRDIAQLTRVTAEVQKTAMALRMVPVGTLFRRMTRLVRDLAKRSGKKAELEMIGEETELDRTIVEELADPLVHMVRNSMDHGLESPAERRAAGKSEAGTLTMKAEHKAGFIVIELRDDGRGLSRARILARARERGLLKPDQEPPDAELWQLIFHPGFSTAEKVTDVSGRGVGMDVVRKHVEKLRGRIEIESVEGRGTAFQLKLPLTLAIIDGLVVEVCGERYIVPIFAVREMFKPSPEMLFTIEGRRQMLLVRERLLPLVRLGRRLGLPGDGKDLDEALTIVGESGGREFCLLVDALVGKQEVVIKSLGPAFAEVRGVAGGAILGDGRIGLILDMASLAQTALAPAQLEHAHLAPAQSATTQLSPVPEGGGRA